MKRTSLVMLAMISSVVLAACGSDDAGSSTAGNGVDRAFVAEMVPHHRSAVDMAKIAQKRGQSAFVKQLASDIVRTQSDELTTLREQDAELAADGVKKGSLGVPMEAMGMGTDIALLETADPFDRAFLEMMLPHHVGAVEMAKAELAKGADPELKQLAEEIIAAQEREIREMREAL